jgi:predicted ATP-dependent Lon-type protease
MLSNARIYVFDLVYQNSNWLSEHNANQLAGTMSQLFTTGIEYFTFKNLNFINAYESSIDKIKYSCQLHIEKIIYKENKILCKEYIAELRSKIKGQLKKISLLKFGSILIVNDEFNFASTSGFLIDNAWQGEI